MVQTARLRAAPQIISVSLSFSACAIFNAVLGLHDHQSNGAPVYPERKLSICWDPSSAACLGSAPLSWQAWMVSETALETSGGTRGSHLAVGNITSLNNFIGALLYPPSVVPFS